MLVVRLLLAVAALFVAVAVLKLVLVVALVAAVLALGLYALGFVRRLTIPPRRPLRRVERLAKPRISIR